MATEPTFLIGAATALVTALAHAFVHVSKELREWRRGHHSRARLPRGSEISEPTRNERSSGRVVGAHEQPVFISKLKLR
jgi:hypothetical protein